MNIELRSEIGYTWVFSSITLNIEGQLKWGFHIGGAHLEVCVGVVSFPIFVFGAPPCMRGGFNSGFVLMFTHQMHLFKGLQYISPLALFVSGVLACVHSYHFTLDCWTSTFS